jgi:linoleoyl-CoA desaturase
MIPTVKFARKDPQNFFPTIRKRVNEYFEKNEIQKTGNGLLYLKTIIVFAFYFIPFALIFAQVLPVWGALICYLLMGLGNSGIGLCVMHDANHGSYSKVKWVNTMMEYTTNMIGASSFTWKIQHNVLHHSYTNMYELDEDIDDKPFLRLSPEGKLKWYHKFQHWYAPLLYSFATLSWVIKKDFKQLIDYNKSGMTERCGFNPTRETIIMIVSKVFYYFYIIALPIMLGVSLWVVILGFVLLHIVSGLLITFVFQLAHLVEGPEHTDIPHDGKMNNTWAIHQLRSTANFATKNKLVTFLVGGLNFQIEHHLFPTISHIHYAKISEIVKGAAKEFNLPYHEFAKVNEAVISHMRVLKMLGQGNMEVQPGA